MHDRSAPVAGGINPVGREVVPVAGMLSGGPLLLLLILLLLLLLLVSDDQFPQQEVDGALATREPSWRSGGVPPAILLLVPALVEFLYLLLYGYGMNGMRWERGQWGVRGFINGDVEGS